MLAGRKTLGEVEGAVVVLPGVGVATLDEAQRRTAFVPAVSYPPGDLTVLQALQYAAQLIVPVQEGRDGAVADRVREVIDALDLRDVLDEPLNRDPDTSHGQTKIHCVAIATELLRSPGK